MRFILSFPALLFLCGFLQAQPISLYPSRASSGSVDSVYQEAMYALFNEEYKKFFNRMEQVIETDSTCFKAIAQAAIQTGRITKGAEPFSLLAKKALEIAPRDWVEVAYSEVLNVQLSGDIDSIPKILEKAFENNKAIEGYFLLGNFHEDIGELKSAHYNYFRMYRLAPDFAPGYRLLSRTSKNLGYDYLSEEMIKSYVKKQSLSAKTFDVYGNYLMKKGEVREAAVQFRKAFQLDSTYIFSLEKAEKLTESLPEEFKSKED